MPEYIKKWNNYKIGSVEWINKNRTHFSRVKFIDYILNSDVKSILEIGGGELWEAQELLKSSKEINYSVADISPLFLDFANKIDGITVYQADMVDLPFDDNQFDMIYMNSVLEHSPDIAKTIKGFSRVSKYFYFTMFKWANVTGGLESYYKSKKHFYSTVFNINQLIELIKKYGNIEDIFLCSPEEYISTLDDYMALHPEEDRHRDSNYLSIVGKWNNG